MDRTSGGWGRFFSLAVVVSCLSLAGDVAFAQSALRGMDAASRPAMQPLADTDYPPAVASMSPQLFGSDGGGLQPGCTAYGDDGCATCGHGRTDWWPAGVELTFLRPRFKPNRAFMTESDGNNDLEFDYDLELSPRVWLGYEMCDGLGWRLTWWQFDHNADPLYSAPSADAEISTPTIRGFDIASDTAGDLLLATSRLNAYTFDWEITKSATAGCWRTDVAAGVRYASAMQMYEAQLRNSTGVLEDQVDFNHWVRGVGPTLSLGAAKYVTGETNVFVRGRGSVLFGNNKWHLHGSDDLTLTTPVVTNQDAREGETLTILEVQAGIGWEADRCCCQPWQPFATVAFEGQFWDGPGDAVHADGNLGFLGFILSAGCHF